MEFGDVRMFIARRRDLRAKANNAIYPVVFIALSLSGFLSPAQENRRCGERRDHSQLRDRGNARAILRWPSVVRAANGDLLVLLQRPKNTWDRMERFSGRVSTDNGESWEPPSVVYDTPI